MYTIHSAMYTYCFILICWALGPLWTHKRIYITTTPVYMNSKMKWCWPLITKIRLSITTFIGHRCQPLITEIQSGYQPSITEIQCGSCQPSIIKIHIGVDHGKGKGEWLDYHQSLCNDIILWITAAVYKVISLVERSTEGWKRCKKTVCIKSDYLS